MTMAPTERITDIGVRLFKAFMNKVWYPFLNRRLDAEEVAFLNYGYEEDPPLGLPPSTNPTSPSGTPSSSTTRPQPNSTSAPNRCWRSVAATAAEPLTSPER